MQSTILQLENLLLNCKLLDLFVVVSFNLLLFDDRVDWLIHSLKTHICTYMYVHKDCLIPLTYNSPCFYHKGRIKLKTV